MYEKTCTKCLSTKQLEEFRDQPRGKFGKRSHCKKCEYASQKEYYKNNRETRRLTEKKYRAKNPEVFARRDRKYYLKHKEVLLEKNKIWKEQNPEQRKALGRRSQNIRRARKLNNGQEPYTESQVINTYCTNCHICNTKINFKAPRKVGISGWELGLHIDHVVPLSKGGPDSLQNVKPSHGKCNLEKNSMA
jgi:5-methylcytosine-specific restriction endonuclease McrA